MSARTSPPRKLKPSAGRGAGQRSAQDPQRVIIRRVQRRDLDGIIELDATVTGMAKRSYWHSVFRRYGSPGHAERQFLVADAGRRVVGFVIGEVRDWEFGSQPCGWVFAIDVDPAFRLVGTGTRLLDAICSGFRSTGVKQVRTILARDNKLILSFFRSQGMMAGPFIPLEMELDE